MSAELSFENVALLALDGDIPEAGYLADLAARHAIVVAADGAAIRLKERNVLPDLIIGDLDSLGEAEREFSDAGVAVIRVESQEENDLEKGLGWIIGRGFDRVTIVGAAGGMIDHALNNFSVLAKYAHRLAITLRDPLWQAHIITDSLTLATDPGDRVSLIPLPYALLTTAGLAWGLRMERLEIGVRGGASNRATGEEIAIDLAEGVVAVIHYPSPTPRADGTFPPLAGL